MAVPTKWPIAYKCGHTFKTDLGPNSRWSKPPSKREEFAAWASKTWADPNAGMDCPKCFKEIREKNKQVDFNQWMLDVEEFERKYSLPELRGTEKMLSSGLVDSARRDRHSVVSELFDHARSEHLDKHGDLLDCIRDLDWAGWWTNNLGFKTRKERNYGQEEFVELILDGAEEEARRKENHQDTEYIDSENPHDWDGSQ